MRQIDKAVLVSAIFIVGIPSKGKSKVLPCLWCHRDVLVSIG